MSFLESVWRKIITCGDQNLKAQLLFITELLLFTEIKINGSLCPISACNNLFCLGQLFIILLFCSSCYYYSFAWLLFYFIFSLFSKNYCGKLIFTRVANLCHL
ncbi:hypothetical protein M5K25_005463 [Dendrobium thyrsiflorum]|uniref:Uncharacterized protein n=1 Tax=Dendrobium thyrsiflorum TaxID=117978 RepID=A0ABD0VIJ8_DENTH